MTQKKLNSFLAQTRKSQQRRKVPPMVKNGATLTSTLNYSSTARVRKRLCLFTWILTLTRTLMTCLWPHTKAAMSKSTTPYQVRVSPCTKMILLLSSYLLVNGLSSATRTTISRSYLSSKSLRVGVTFRKWNNFIRTFTLLYLIFIIFNYNLFFYY